jgi:hypothetical protein
VVGCEIELHVFKFIYLYIHLLTNFGIRNFKKLINANPFKLFGLSVESKISLL